MARKTRPSGMKANKVYRGGSFKAVARKIAAKQGKNLTGNYKCVGGHTNKRTGPNQECYRCRNG